MTDNDFEGARIYLARGARKWGLGFTQYQALDACRPDDGEEFSVVKLPEGAHAPAVDQMGTLYWKGTVGDCEKIGKFKAEAYPEEECAYGCAQDFDWEEVA